jgi:hypothetical protein
LQICESQQTANHAVVSRLLLFLTRTSTSSSSEP